MAMDNLIAGLFRLSLNNKQVPVPLISVEANVELRETLAEVQLQQVFHNQETTPIEAVYRFPIDEQAAICGFEAIVGEKRIVGVCKGKEEAKETYDNAIASGHGAFLLEQASDDVFQLKVGNLLPDQQCTIIITYVALTNTEDDKIRFVLPTRVFPRFQVPSTHKTRGRTGSSSSSSSSSSAPPRKRRRSDKDEALASPSGRGGGEAEYKMNLKVKVNMVEDILKISSPSHDIDMSDDTTVTFVSPEPLDRDFVLSIALKHISMPVVITEWNEATSSQVVLLSFMPQFDTKTVLSEFIFLVDRSGSMGGSSMQHARKSLNEFISRIPKSSVFNIVGFGSGFKRLFGKSVKPTAANLKKASAYARTMDADFGGTDIYKPLESIYSENLLPGFARQIFLLTDGSVWNTDQMIKMVRKNSNTTRLFSFGLGEGVSTELVKGIARAGGGSYEFSMKGEDLSAKVVRIVKRALQPAVTDVKLVWRGLNIHQTPFNLPPIFHQGPYRVFGFIQGEQQDGSFVAQLSGLFNGKRKTYKMEINLREKVNGRIVHCLAAREAIRDLEDESSVFHKLHSQGKLEGVLEDVVKAKIVELGEKYSIASKHTSFVAVEKRHDDMEIEGDKRTANPKSEMQRRDVPQHTKRRASSRGGAAPRGGNVDLLHKLEETKVDQKLITTGCDVQREIISPFGAVAHISASRERSKGLFYGPNGAFSHVFYGPRTLWNTRACWMISALALVQTIEPIRTRVHNTDCSKLSSDLLESFAEFSKSWSCFGQQNRPLSASRRELASATQLVRKAFAAAGFGKLDYSPCDAVTLLLKELETLFTEYVKVLGGPLWKCFVYSDYKAMGHIPNAMFGPQYLIFFNPSAGPLSRSFKVPGYEFYSLICMHELTYPGTEKHTIHFNLLAASKHGYFCFDDTWSIGQGGHQGGLVRQEHESGLDFMFENVAVFVYVKKQRRKRYRS